MKKIIQSTIGIVLGLLIFFACSDPYPEKIELEKFMYLSLSGAMDKSTTKTINLDKDTTFSLSVSYGGTINYNQGEITIHIGADNSLIDSFNIKNSTEYMSLPNDSYTLDKSTITIENGNNLSDLIRVTIHPNRINFVNEYLLPISIKSATGSNIPTSEEFNTAYFIIKGNVQTEPEVEKWTLVEASSVWQAEYAAENMWDGNRKSYWHSSLNGMPQWFIVNMNQYKLIDGFSWVNRQDSQTAAPKHVKIETSINGTDWVEVMDIPEMPISNQKQVLKLPEKIVAHYFKVTILSNWANEPYTYLAEIITWEGEPTEDYDWEKKTWEVIDQKSQWNDGADAASNIIDGDKNTHWHSHPSSSNGMPQWVVIDMQKTRPAIKGFLIWNRQNDHGSEPKNIVFYISDDNSNWTEVLNLAEMSNDYKTELDYKTTNPVPGRYLKIEVKSNWDNQAWTYLGEVTPY